MRTFSDFVQFCDLLQKLKNSGIDTSCKMVIERDPVADIESQGSEWEEDSRNKGEDEKTSNEYDDIESSINHKFEDKKREQMPITDKKTQKHKTRNSKKPPRPRKSPSLTTADLRLVKEISELVIKKRAKVERLKSMKKMRAVKPPSPSSKTTLIAMIITLLFVIIIVFQGKYSTLSFHETIDPLAS
ncbi:hypothetical protein L2E82_20311 [Cichorium intybus]|uniref:Uncharacterized protein n=1 Tax=Cichorium intybus TaxID=13427 RepID=A0ACB9DTE5_CICIN|nr:hypothetical protein L2E82_20311 [Cichorium intybus]